MESTQDDFFGKSFCKSNDTQRSDCRSTQSFSPKTHPPKMQARYMESTQDDFFGKLKKLILGKEKKQEYNNKLQKVYSSIFAPSEIKRNDYMMVQVFLYKEGDERYVACKANEVDPDAECKNYTPLSVGLKEGDKVKISLLVPNKDIQVEDPVQEITWQGRITDCQFAMYISNEFNASTILATVVLSVNGAPVGRMIYLLFLSEWVQVRTGCGLPILSKEQFNGRKPKIFPISISLDAERCPSVCSPVSPVA